jgi:WD40 repeat protein
MHSQKSLLLIIFLLLLLSAIPSAHAAEPLWTYSSPGIEIGGVTIPSDGSAIAVAGGKILLFSRNGTLLAKEPFGDQVFFTPDGSYLLSSYADTVYLFKRGNPANGSEAPLQKVWDRSLPAPVGSVDISDDGKFIVASLKQAGTYVYDTRGTMIEGNHSFNAIIRVANTGFETIVGISPRVLCYYDRYLIARACSNSEDDVVRTLPDFMEITKDGSIAVFDDAQRVRSVFVWNSTLHWVNSAGGDVTALAITPSGSGILVGTYNGNTSLFDKQGNLSWSYASNPGNTQDAEITCVVLSKEGTVAAAGSYDGKIFALNSKGEMIWSNQTKDHIRHIAMNADGSLVVAAGDNTVYAFSPSAQSTTAVRTTVKPATRSLTQSVSTLPEKSQTQKPITREPTPREITAVPTEYSVIRTSTQSPLSGIISLTGLLVALLIATRRQ